MIDLTDTTRRRIGYFLIACATAFTVIQIVNFLSIGDFEQVVNNIVLITVFGLVTVAALRAAPRNGAVWALIWGAVVGSSSEPLGQLVHSRTGVGIDAFESGAVSFAPSSLDTLSAVAVNLYSWTWIWNLILAIHLVLLFPAGRTSGRPARLLIWAATLVMVIGSVWSAIQLAPWVDVPYSELLAEGWLDGVSTAFMILLFMIPFAFVDLSLRFRRSTGVERLQFKWVAWAMAFFAGTLFISFPVEALGWSIPDAIFTVALAGVPASIGIAITRYRLYDIDVVISRTLVSVVLVSFITLVYAGLVVGVGSMFGGSSLGWQIAATAFVAVVFEPVRDRVQRWVNRLVFGRRATPYEVLSDLTGRLAATEREEGMLDRMALRLAEGTGADQAIIWVDGPSGFEPAACAPDQERLAGPVADLAAIPGTVVPIRHDGVILGALSVETRRGGTLTPTETRLVEDLAGSAGLFLRRLRLDQQLERKALELEDSRRRLVDAQDVERRRLERELNEGAQQRVVALKVQLAIAEQKARHERSERTASLLAQMTAETQDAIDQIQALANGIYPPLLEAEGLATAVRALGELAPVDVRVDTDVSRRYPLPLEGAVYFCVSEALTNAVKHGQAPIAISVVDHSGELAFTVSDSGPGFDPTNVRRGAGLNNMSDRLDALEGTIIIDTTPGIRTVVAGRLPLTSVEAMA